jgi:photosystem II stability/assembly factor-like uncharacterized protein
MDPRYTDGGFRQMITRRTFGGLATAAAAQAMLPAWAANRSLQWVKLPTEPYKGKQDDISFIDADHGWYGNGTGKLFRTTDSGATWNKIWEQTGTFIRALGFVDEKIGFLGNVGTNYYPGVTDSHPLYRTDDGGVTWQPVTAPGIEKVAGICGIDILLTRRIFQGEMRTSQIIHAAGRVGGPAMIMQSLDNGVTWRVLDLSKQAGMILDVKFLDPKTGHVCASAVDPEGEGEALILRTTDGGEMENCWKMSWPSKRVGYATVQSYNTSPSNTRRVIAKTIDGGKTWRELSLVNAPRVQQFGIGFVDENHGWVGCVDNGYETRDGGKTWTPIAFGRAVNKIRIVSKPDGSKVVFAIGADVYRLANG